jgi:hypothetical protein
VPKFKNFMQMKRISLLILMLFLGCAYANAQTPYNPFTQNIHFEPEPTALGFECGTIQTAVFTMGLTTVDDATLWQTNPLKVTICVNGFTLIGSAASNVTGSYAANFNWAYSGSNCLIGTQNQTLFGTGYDPLFPNAASTGPIRISLKVPDASPVATVLSVNVTLQVPAYMATFNSIADDPEATQTQTFCNCYVLTDPGAIAANQTFCGPGNPVAFTNSTSANGGSGSTIIYQWQQLIGATWTDISGATGATYDAPTLSTTTQFRRNAKRAACGTYLNSSPLTVTINPVPVADAGLDKIITCTTPTTLIGTSGIAGNTYSWSLGTGLSTTNSATPTATPALTTTYTVTVTNSSGCTATDAVLVTVNKGLPIADAGSDINLNCTTTSGSIGTSAIAGNTYAWTNATGLSSTTTAITTASPSATTSYTVTATGANGCTATDIVIVNVNTTPPAVDAGADKNLNCTTTSTAIGATSVAGVTYAWLPATGLSATNIAQPTASPSTTTNYTVTATGSNGCTASDVVNVSVNTTTPTANAGPNKTNTCTTPTSTIGTTAIAGNTYVWAPSTGLNSTTTAIPTANPAATTTYTVTVTGSNGCTATSTVTVTIDKGTPLADAGLDKLLNCTTTSTTIGTAAIAGNTYSWNPTTNLNSGSIATPVTSTSVTRTYTVTVTSANGCTSTDAVLVTVNTDLPIVNAGPSKDLTCTTTSATIGTSAIAGVTYVWAPAAGLSSTTTATPTANPSSTTIYTVTATGTNGCTATDVVFVNVDTTPPTVDAGADKTITCSVTSTTIGTATISGNTYVWAPATGLSSTTIAQPTATPLITTSYTVTVTGTNGCTATDVVVVTIDKALPVANAGPNKTLTCATTSTTIGTTAIGGNTYAWSPSTGLSSTTIAQPTTTTTTTRTYTVTVTGSNSCTATSTVVVTVNTTPPVVNAGPSKIICKDSSTVIGTAAIAGTTYSWLPTTALSSSTIAQPTASPLATTNYTVTATGSNGCTATSVVTVTVNICVVNVSGTVFNDVNALTNTNVDGVGIGLPSGTQLYANLINPATGTVVASVPINANGTYQILNVPANTNYNMVLSTTQGTPGSTTLPTPNIPSNWVNTGEDCCDNAGSDGTVNGTTSLSVGTLDVPQVNFGIQQPPTPGTNIQPLQTNPGGIVSVTVPSSAWSGTDPSNGTISSLTISSFPSNATSITINGTTYTSSNFPVGGVTIPTNITGQPIQSVSVDPIDGAVTVNIPYYVTDNAGANSTPSGFVQLPFGIVNISGTVFVDNNGPANVDGTGIGSPSGTPLYANLVNSTTGNVVKTIPINANGTYQFTDVLPNTTYSVVLSMTNGTIGSTPPAATLPTGWSTVSEDCCDNTGNDGTPNGINSVTVVTTDVPNVNFGIRQPLSVGNLVWVDANRNGIKETAELGINNASVNIYLDANADGIPDGSAVQNTSTDGTGHYVFNGLNPGNYILGVTPPAVAGGTYTSSITGEEANPNLNVDNNDNGVNNVSGEIRSGIVTLAAGTEPTGELPNNATAPDANANLTVDFGFFVCPANFTFPPQYTCPNETVNLTSFEPVNYTGGVWKNSSNQILTQTLVSKGTFTYTFTDGTCTASGSITLSDNIPDYSPNIQIAPNAITGVGSVKVIITISELLNRKSCTPVYVLVPRLEPRYIFTFDPLLTNVVGSAVNNPNWQFFSTNPNFYIWKYIGTGGTFPAFGSSKFGYVGTYNPNDTDGQTTFSVQIFQGSGGENNTTNNTDSDNLIYFR